MSVEGRTEDILRLPEIHGKSPCFSRYGVSTVADVDVAGSALAHLTMRTVQGVCSL